MPILIVLRVYLNISLKIRNNVSFDTKKMPKKVLRQKCLAAKNWRNSFFTLGANKKIGAKFYSKKARWRLAQRDSENGGLSLTQHLKNGARPMYDNDVTKICYFLEAWKAPTVCAWSEIYWAQGGTDYRISRFEGMRAVIREFLSNISLNLYSKWLF